MSTGPLSDSPSPRPELLELALGAAGLVITETDVARSLVHFSPDFARMWGVDLPSPQPEAVIFGGVHADDLAAAQAKRAELLADEGSRNRLEYRVVAPDGSIRWIESFGGATRAPDGGLRIVAAHRDVTAARRTQDALRDSEERLRLAVESGRLGVYDWDVTRDRSVLYGVAELLGVPPDDSPGGFGRWQALIHPDDRARMHASHLQIMSGQDDLSNRYRVVRPDGETRWIESGGKAYRDAAGRVVRVLGYCRDVTERALTEQRNRELTELLDRARDAIAVHDLENRVVFWNQGAERLFGWTASEILGRDARDTAWKRACPALADFDQRLLERGEVRGDVELVVRSGDSKVVDVGWTLVTDDAGRPRAKLCVAADVTERRLWEKHTQRAERLASLGALAGGVAHDINNALAPIQLAVDLLREPCDEADRAALLDQAAACVSRAAGLVRRILDFAGGEEGERDLIEPAELLAHAAATLSRELPPSIELVVDVAPNVGRLLGDFNQLTQVLLNLGLNARDAMPSGGRLTLRAAPDPREPAPTDANAPGAAPPAAASRFVSLQVSDEGTGVAPSDVDRIFDPFFTRKQPGRGLGLSAVQSIVQRHGGVVDIDTRLGRGSTFSVRLPATDRAALPRREPERALEATRVLLVDPAEDVRRWSRKTLEDFGCRVLTAADGRTALAEFEKHRGQIGLVVVDLLMRTDDDCTVVEALRKLDPRVPIVAACGPTEVRGESLRLGAVAFLEKPFSPQSLLRTLHQVVARRPGD